MINRRTIQPTTQEVRMPQFPSIGQYNPNLDKDAAENIKAQMLLKSLAQLDLLREKMFFNAMEPTASMKEVLAVSEHLVKSTDLELISRKPVEQGQGLVNFGLVFHSPGGDVKVVGNVQASSVPAPRIEERVSAPVIEAEFDEMEESWGSLVGD